MGKKKNSTVLIKRTQNTRKTNFKKLMKCKLVTQKCLEKLKNATIHAKYAHGKSEP